MAQGITYAIKKEAQREATKDKVRGVARKLLASMFVKPSVSPRPESIPEPAPTTRPTPMKPIDPVAEAQKFHPEAQPIKNPKFKPLTWAGIVFLVTCVLSGIFVQFFVPGFGGFVLMFLSSLIVALIVFIAVSFVQNINNPATG